MRFLPYALVALFCFALGFAFGVPYGAYLQEGSDWKASDYANFWNIGGTWLGAVATTFVAALALGFQHKADKESVSYDFFIPPDATTDDPAKLRITCTSNKPINIICVSYSVQGVFFKFFDIYESLSNGNLPTYISYGQSVSLALNFRQACQYVAMHDCDPSSLKVYIHTSVSKFDVDLSPFSRDIHSRVSYSKAFELTP